MRIAVIGTGIAGLTAASLLHGAHDLVVYEAGDWVGGHAHTVDVPGDQGTVAVDTGFIVFNPERYPNFVALLDRLGVASRPTGMSFSVRCERTGLEYGATSARALFSQKRNLLRPAFWGMLRDIGRFRRTSLALIEGDAPADLSLGDYLRQQRFGAEFVEHFLAPMGAAIWSTEPGRMADFPAVTFARFFHNHRFLEPGQRRPWRTVVGGSRAYVERLTAPWRDRIRLRTPVTAVTRFDDRVEVVARGAARPERFDRVVLATHSDQALALLADPTGDERRILSAIPYAANDVVLHQGVSVLPRRRAAWAAWNAYLPADRADRVKVTYHMNLLQGLVSRRPLLLSLNRTPSIDPATILGRWTYAHPQLTAGAIAAQKEFDRLDGRRRTHFCGAYWGYGFHEDGVESGLRVAGRLGRTV